MLNIQLLIHTSQTNDYLWLTQHLFLTLYTYYMFVLYVSWCELCHESCNQYNYFENES